MHSCRSLVARLPAPSARALRASLSSVPDTTNTTAPPAPAPLSTDAAVALQTTALLSRLASVKRSTTAIHAPSYNAATEFAERREKEFAAIKAGQALPEHLKAAESAPSPELAALLSSAQPQSTFSKLSSSFSSSALSSASSSLAATDGSAPPPSPPSSSNRIALLAGAAVAVATAVGVAVWRNSAAPDVPLSTSPSTSSSPPPPPVAATAKVAASAPPAAALAAAVAAKSPPPPVGASSAAAAAKAPTAVKAEASPTTTALSAAVAKSATAKTSSTAPPPSTTAAQAVAATTAAVPTAAPVATQPPAPSPEELAIEAARARAEHAELERFLDVYFEAKSEAQASAALQSARDALAAALNAATEEHMKRAAEQRSWLERYAAAADAAHAAADQIAAASAAPIAAVVADSTGLSASATSLSADAAELASLRADSARRAHDEAVRLTHTVRLTEHSERAAALVALRAHDERAQAMLAGALAAREAAWHSFAERYAADKAAHAMAAYRADAARFLETRAHEYARAAAAEYATKLAHQGREWAARFDAERTARLAKIQDLETRVAAFAHVFDWQSQFEAVGAQLARMQLALMQVEESIDAAIHTPSEQSASTASLDKALRRLAAAAHGDSLVEAALLSIPTALPAGGVPSAHALLSSFDAVEREARQLAMIPEGGGLGAHLLAYAFGSRLRAERALVGGDDAQACLSRAGYHLEGGDLARCVAELERVRGYAADHGALPAWLAGARARLTVQQAADVVRAHLRLVAAAQANIVATKQL